MTDRAYTYVDAGSAVAGNAGLLRVYSAFLGATASLVQRPAGEEWLLRQAPDFSFAADGVHQAPFELGGASWSEEASPHAALLIGEFDSDDLVVAVRTWAFHECPGLLRQVSIHNFRDRALRIDSVVLDALPLRGDARVWLPPYAQSRPSAVFEDPAAAPAVMAGNLGLAWTIEGGGRYELFAPEPGLCRLRIDEARPLAPGAVWLLPPTGMAAFDGPPANAARALGLFDQHVRTLRTWEADIAEAARAEDDSAYPVE